MNVSAVYFENSLKKTFLEKVLAKIYTVPKRREQWRESERGQEATSWRQLITHSCLSIKEAKVLLCFEAFGLNYLVFALNGCLSYIGTSKCQNKCNSVFIPPKWFTLPHWHVVRHSALLRWYEISACVSCYHCKCKLLAVLFLYQWDVLIRYLWQKYCTMTWFFLRYKLRILKICIFAN